MFCMRSHTPPQVPSGMTVQRVWSLSHYLQHLHFLISFLLGVVGWQIELLVLMIMCLETTDQAMILHLGYRLNKYYDIRNFLA